MRGVVVGLVLCGAAACAGPRLAWPESGAPAPDAAAAFTSATAACRGARVFSAEWQVNGRVGAQRIPRVTLQGAMTRDGRMTLRAVAPAGPPIFILGGTADAATLVLPRDRRYVRATAAGIIEALIGLPLGPSDWVDLMAGCVASGTPGAGLSFGHDLIVPVGADVRVRLARDGREWRVVAGLRHDASVEYTRFLGRWPAAARVRSRPGDAVAINLDIAIAQVFVNTDVPDRAFAAPAVDGYDAMSLETLRSAGPLGEKGGG